MKLKDYPRPKDDNGLGVHWGAGDCVEADVIKYLPTLHEMKIKWVKMLGKRPSHDLGACEQLAKADIEPVVRLYKNQPHPNALPTVDQVKMYVDRGAHYFEFGNEPNISVPEWDLASWRQGDQPNKVASQMIKAFAIIKQGGGIPMTPAMSPGGEIHHRTFLTDMFNQVEVLQGVKHVLDGAAMAIHPRPLNHPPDYTDDTGVMWLEYKWFQSFLTQWGLDIPLIATEHGYAPGNHDDTTMSAITIETHRDYNLALIDQVNSNAVGNSFFAGCFWLLGERIFNNTTFEVASWLDSSYIGGKELPIVQTMKDRPFQLRPYQWEESMPEPTPSSIPGPSASEVYPQWVAAKKAAGDTSPSTTEQGLTLFLGNLENLGILKRPYAQNYTNDLLVRAAEQHGFPVNTLPQSQPQPVPTPQLIPDHPTAALSTYEQDMETLLTDLQTSHTKQAQAITAFLARRAARKARQ